MRERELKLLHIVAIPIIPTSLPMRERELKRHRGTDRRAADGSLPMRERELKHHPGQHPGRRQSRSPCGSAN